LTTKWTVLLFVHLVTLIIGQTAFARQGCCSHHAGVCGCQCCDGSPLSAKCEPYYPQCQETGAQDSPGCPIDAQAESARYESSERIRCNTRCAGIIGSRSVAAISQPPNSQRRLKRHSWWSETDGHSI
jgi:hypothetical protein